MESVLTRDTYLSAFWVRNLVRKFLTSFLKNICDLERKEIMSNTWELESEQD